MICQVVAAACMVGVMSSNVEDVLVIGSGDWAFIEADMLEVAR